MNRKITLLLILSLFGFYSQTATAQTCPPNIDFELGNTSFWQFFIGTATQISPTAHQVAFSSPTATPPIIGRHTLTAGVGIDPIGGFPVVAPGGGGSYSLKLGDKVNGQLAERARYFVNVPPGASDYSLIYRYAVVIQDGTSGHDSSSQPRVNVELFDTTVGGIVIPCEQFTYFVGGSLPGYLPFPTSSGFAPGQYKPWTTASVNLSGLGGHVVQIDFTALDCAFGGHFGYGYFDLTCGHFAISVNTCNDTVASLNAPDGFESYTWVDSLTFTVTYGTGQSISLPLPPFPTTYAAIIAPYAGYGCPDTLYTRIAPSHLVVNAKGDTSVCLGKHAFLDAGASDVALPLTYRWLPAVGLNCATCATPVATIPGTTLYTVVVTNAQGCHKADTVRVTELKISSAIVSTSVSCHGNNNGSAIVTPIGGFAPYTYTWSTTPVQHTPNADTLVAGTYTVTVIDSQTCRTTNYVTIPEPPPTVLTLGFTYNPITCKGHNGKITLHGLNPGNTYHVVYLFNGVPKTWVDNTAGGDSIVMQNLPAGVYSKITLDSVYFPCPVNALGPVNLYDPHDPAIPGMGYNGPLCAGNTLQLASSCATPNVLFNWTGPGGFSSILDTPAAIATATFTNAGLYKVTVMGIGDSCVSFDTLRVVIKPNPDPYATNNSAICAGDTLKLMSASYTGGTTYSWFGPDRFISSEQNPMLLSAPATASGTYTVTITLDGCSDTANTLVLVKPLPDAPQVSDTFYCQGAFAAPLKAIGAGLRWHTTPTGGINIPWPTPLTDVPGETTWYVNQTNGACIGPRLPIKATVYPHNMESLMVSDSVICGGNYVTFNMLNTLNAKDDYQGITWDFSNGDSVQNVNPVIHSFEVTGATPVTITARVYHKYCADTVVTKTIKAFPYPVMHLGDDTSICAGDPAILIGDFYNENRLAASWRWNTGQTTSRISVDKPGLYYARVTINGCSTSDTVLVSNNCYVDIPNVFTPNEDGVNDFFFPRQYLAKGLTAFRMDIYNRWGQLVYSCKTTDGRGWDGKFNDVPQPEGVYVYDMNATFKDGKMEHHNGNVTLLR